MKKRKKWKRVLAGVTAVLFLAAQSPAEVLADEEAGGDGVNAGVENVSGTVDDDVENPDAADTGREDVQSEGGEDGGYQDGNMAGNGLTDDAAEEGEPVAQAGEGVQTGYVDCTNRMVNWTYDPETKTTVVTGEGMRVGSLGTSCFPSETEYIRFENCKIEGSLAGLFKEMSNLLSIDFTGLTMANVTDMGFMFYGCSGLTSLDLGGFDTSQVTDMELMFQDCSGLTSLDLREFDTSQVTDMVQMFYGCSGLTTLETGGFDTSHVTDMMNMFHGCSSLTTLDVGGFDTSQVTVMSGMFYGCSSLTTLDVGGFDTSHVTDMGWMFYGCSSLTTLDVGGFDTSHMTVMSGMFYGCSGLTNLEVSGFDTSQVTVMNGMFGNCSGLANLEVSGFVTNQVTDMRFMFYNCSGLANLEVSGFDTSQVTDMAYMFGNCSGLANLEVSGFDTSQVTDMVQMFYGCSGLTELDLSSFNTSQVTGMGSMFVGCTSLQTLHTPQAMGSVVASLPATYTTPDGTQTKELTAAFSGTTLTKLNDTQNLPSGYVDRTENMISWTYDQETKTAVVTGSGTRKMDYIDPSSYVASFPAETEQIIFSDCTIKGSLRGLFFGLENLRTIDFSGLTALELTDMDQMFSDCSNLTELDLSNFDTSNVVSMSHMFSGCSSLIELNLSSFNTSRVTDMASMFHGCSGLTSLEVSGFDTSHVTNMNALFARCSSLTKLDVGGFDTSQVYIMGMMFSDCSSLTSLEVSGFDTSHVTNMNAMFAGCSGLTNLEVGGFDTSQVRDMSLMFWGCSGLISLDLGEFNTSQVTNMASMFHGCSGLINLDLRGFDTSQVTDMGGMFSDCSSLTSLEVSGFDTSQVTDMAVIFFGCSGLASLDVSGFDTSHVTNMGGMFYGCSGLINLDLRGFDTSQVTDMRDMFNDCSGLTSLDVSGFDTSHVTDMTQMFWNCSGLTSLELRGFDTSQVTDMMNMFKGCSSLTTLEVGEFDTSHVTDMRQMFLDCSGLTSLEVSGFDTSQVTDMVSMFRGCSSLTSLEVGGFDTSQVTNMGSMFYDCSGLTNLEISGFDTSHVERMSGMFRNCSSLTGLDLGRFDTSQVTNMKRMFSGCSNLTKLDLQNFDMTKVTSVGAMFEYCTSLTELDLSNFILSSETEAGDLLSDCSSLVKINAPAHTAQSVSLPSGEGIAWYLPDGTEVTELPQGLETSIWLSASQDTAPERETIRVSTSEELRSAIGSFRNIILADGIYEIDEQLKLSELENMSIQAENPGRAEILSHDGTMPVLTVRQSKNIELSGCIFGHDVLTDYGCGDGGCVISLNDAQEIKIVGCDLYGCGTIGIECYWSQDISVEDCVIRDCKNDIAYFYYNAGNIALSGCIMSGNNYDDSDEDSALADYDNGQVENWRVENCIFLNNRHRQLINDSDSKMAIADCVFHDNTWDGQEPKEYGICLNGLTWQIDGDVLKLGYPLYFEDGASIESAQVEPLPYSDASLPWKKYSYQSVDKAWEKSEELPSAVKFVPYDIVLAEGENKGNFTLGDEALPEGLTLSSEGRISGVPKADGSFSFTVRMTDNEGTVEEVKYLLTVAENTDTNFDTYADPGYELLELVPDIHWEDLSDDGQQLMVSRGLFEEFVALYMDGDLLVQGVDYTAESGSTRITIMNQTLKRNGAGTHTLAMEFRVVGTNDLRWAAQNFVIEEDKADEGNGNQGGEGNEGNENQGSEGNENQGSQGGEGSEGNGGQGGESSEGNGSQNGEGSEGNGGQDREDNEEDGSQNGEGNENDGSQDAEDEEDGTEQETAAAADAVIHYQVRPGDTLWKIAEKFFGSGRRWGRIYEDNMAVIPDPNKLRIGQTLTISLTPGNNVSSATSAAQSPAGEGTMPASGKSYTVEAGDNLYKIAMKIYGQGRCWNDIYQLNRNIIAEPEKIYAGQKILLP